MKCVWYPQCTVKCRCGYHYTHKHICNSYSINYGDLLQGPIGFPGAPGQAGGRGTKGPKGPPGKRGQRGQRGIPVCNMCRLARAMLLQN